jgi:hydrogenase-4 component E
MEKLAATSAAGVLLDLSGVVILLLAFACLGSKLFNRYVAYYGAQSVVLSFAAGVAAWTFHSVELWILAGLTLAIKGIGIPVATRRLLLGALAMVVRRHTVAQLIGWLIVENGVFLGAITLVATFPFIVEAGIFLDIAAGVLIMPRRPCGHVPAPPGWPARLAGSSHWRRPSRCWPCWCTTPRWAAGPGSCTWTPSAASS